ncbi:hypothetical protein MHH33_03960 [Paenisporosarcina sp. FSL H8-0542]|uniref:hypothetical protein n=1 Tax=unclassified Paenisporosarcina TaxID=2642018 RepID=UPI00034E430F|nr:hypothetical protein [Paenisporosarcina sp. HGH0030]EPD50229.1 hypothetical protein HMPREF1210_02800 [Paenisporosarcina sp. HGH0030]
MTKVNELDGAKVIKQTKNDGTLKLSTMYFEEKDGTTIEVPITALAIAKYEEERGYYLFMCDSEWTVQDDHHLESLEEAITWAEKNFDVTDKEWM